LHRAPLEYHYPHTKFHENLPSSSKVIGGGADRNQFLSDRRHLQFYQLHTKLHPNPPISSNIITGFLCIHHKSLNVHHFGIGSKGAPTSEVQTFAILERLTLPSTSSPPYKMLSKSNNLLKSCTHLISLNICHFGMVEATGLAWSGDHLQWHHLHTKFHTNPPISSKVATTSEV
jgi:hypothetical protein